MVGGRTSQFIAVCLIGLGNGCVQSDQAAGMSTTVGRDEGEPIVGVHNTGLGEWPQDHQQSARRILTIGVVNGPAPFEFASIRSIDVDSQGHVYVFDTGHRRVRKFAPDGRFLVEMGGDGGGPSEFAPGPTGMPNYLGGMTLVGDSLVVVHDPWAWKLVYFSLDGEFYRDVDLDRVSPPNRIFDRQSHRVHDLGDGWLVFQHNSRFGSGRLRTEADGQTTLLRVTADGSARDTLVVYRQDDGVPYWLDDRHFELFPKPFPARWHWAVGPSGQIAFGHGGEYRLTIHDAEWVPIARVTRDVAPATVTRDDAADFRTRFPFGGMDELTPEWRRLATEALASFDFPKSWPFFDHLVYDDSGRLWVRRTVRPQDTVAHWDVLDDGLVYLGTIELPVSLTVHTVANQRVYGSTESEFDVPVVQVYALERQQDSLE